MSELGKKIGDGICLFRLMWWALLALELTFLVLLGLMAVISSEPLNVAFQFSLLFIVPTTVGIIIVLYYCERQ